MKATTRVTRWSDMTADERLVSRIEVTPSGCWLWLGALTRGYGRIKRDGRLRIAHRYVYEKLVGPIPKGLQLDHLCNTRACVCPWHLEPVTNRENCQRARKRVAVNG